MIGMRSSLFKALKNPAVRGVIASIFLGIALAVCTASVGHAQTYNGLGIVGGVGAAGTIAGVSQGNIRQIIIHSTQIVLGFLALVAVIVIIIAGIYLVTSVGNDEAKEKAKKAILYAVIGLIIILLSEAIVTIITTFDNGIILGGTGGIVGNTDVRTTTIHIVQKILAYMALVAVVVIVIAGIYLVTSVGNDEAKEKAKKIILYAVVGLIVILLSEAVVTVIIGFDNGSILGGTGGIVGNPNGDIRATVLSILFKVLSYMALIAVVMIVIAGIYLVTSVGNEEAKEKAKKIILYTIIGLFVILFASAIVFIISNLT